MADTRWNRSKRTWREFNYHFEVPKYDMAPFTPIKLPKCPNEAPQKGKVAEVNMGDTDSVRPEVESGSGHNAVVE